MTPTLINHIVDTTAMVLGISREAICSSSRKRANVIARNIMTDVAYNDLIPMLMLRGRKAIPTPICIVRSSLEDSMIP